MSEAIVPAREDNGRFLPGTAGKLLGIDPQALIARYLDGDQTSDIARAVGVHRSAIHQFLIANAPERWQDAQVARALTAKEDATEYLAECRDDVRTAPDALSLARAREAASIADRLLKGAQWELERVCRRIYGNDAPPAANASVTLNFNFAAPVEQPRIIESESEPG